MPTSRSGVEGEGEVTGPRPRGRPWTPAEDAELLALIEANIERALIARKLKRTQPAVNSRSSVLKKRREDELGLKAKGK